MKRAYERPLLAVELFEANEYVAACTSYEVSCSVDAANSYEESIGNAKWGYGGWSGQFHSSGSCGAAENQWLVDSNGDGKIDAMQEHKPEGIDGKYWLDCTLYSDASYTTPISASSVKPGTYIYWTTSASDNRTWHHQGWASEVKTGNRS